MSLTLRPARRALRTGLCLACSILFSGFVIASGGQAQAEQADGNGAATSADAAPPKVLVLTHSAGYKHGSLPLAEQIVAELGRSSGAFEVVVLQGYKQEPGAIDLTMISADYLSGFAGIIMFTTGELPLDASQKQALLDFIRGGGGWIGVHSATDTFYEWPEYGELSGGYFQGHGLNNKPLTLKVEDRDHPATRALGESWTLADEFYRFADVISERHPVAFSRERVHVLLSVDTKASDLRGQWKMEPGGDYALAWCRDFGEGRAFYTALGHRDDVWRSAKFQAHLLGGIRWAIRNESDAR